MSLSAKIEALVDELAAHRADTEAYGMVYSVKESGDWEGIGDHHVGSVS